MTCPKGLIVHFIKVKGDEEEGDGGYQFLLCVCMCVLVCVSVCVCVLDGSSYSRRIMSAIVR